LRGAAMTQPWQIMKFEAVAFVFLCCNQCGLYAGHRSKTDQDLSRSQVQSTTTEPDMSGFFNLNSFMKAYWILVVLLGTSLQTLAQYDSAYIGGYDGFFIGRFLVNRKYTAINVSNDIGNYNVRYRPNKTFSVGLGATYKFLTLNLGVGILQPNEEKGHTRNLDLQLHKFGRKFVTDLVLQFYKGFYIPQGQYASGSAEYYLRPDIRVNTIGLVHQYVFNHRRFSYRAAFQQSEVQKKSAGSFTGGLELFMGNFQGDSTVFPRELQLTPSETLHRMKFIELGPNAGYIYTWVYGKYFVTAGGSVSVNIGINKIYQEDKEVKYTAVSPNSVIRLSTGYNAGKWGVNVLFISRALHLPDFENRSILFNAGNIRMNFVYRFWPSRQAKKLLRGIDKVDKKLKE
jgi:hypothetical protein